MKRVSYSVETKYKAVEMKAHFLIKMLNVQ
ncbi:transposase [Staphylococcus carnosus]|nr:transposase [Staphylococcus carnosus]